MTQSNNMIQTKQDTQQNFNITFKYNSGIEIERILFFNYPLVNLSIILKGGID